MVTYAWIRLLCTLCLPWPRWRRAPSGLMSSIPTPPKPTLRCAPYIKSGANSSAHLDDPGVLLVSGSSTSRRRARRAAFLCPTRLRLGSSLGHRTTACRVTSCAWPSALDVERLHSGYSRAFCHQGRVAPPPDGAASMPRRRPSSSCVTVVDASPMQGMLENGIGS